MNPEFRLKHLVRHRLCRRLNLLQYWCQYLLDPSPLISRSYSRRCDDVESELPR